MILAGEWLLPITGPPIRRGAVRIAGTHIMEVGTLDALRDNNPALPVHDLRGRVIAPGLVNAHTHLSLTSLHGLLPPGDFATWIASLTPAILALDQDDFADSAAFGAVQCLRGGVTSVGDIAYGPEAPAAAADTGVGGVFFWEVLGIDAHELPVSLAGRDFPVSVESCDGRTLCGLSPHSPYTSGPDLLRAVYRYAMHWGFPCAIHVAESAAEVRLLEAGEGPLRATADRLAHSFSAPRMGAVRYLEQLGVLKGMIAIHCVHLQPGEPELLAARASGVVLCPRSNQYLRNGLPPVTTLREAGVRIGLGTDSPASNESIDLFAEARELLAADPGMTPTRALEIMTIEGARLLGIDRDYGSLEPGKHADIIAVELPDSDDPVASFVAQGGPGCVDAVISGGVWRLIDGAPAFQTKPLERGNARVAAKAARALAGN